MLSSVEQAFVGSDEKRAPLTTPAWEATVACARWMFFYCLPLRKNSNAAKFIVFEAK